MKEEIGSLLYRANDPHVFFFFSKTNKEEYILKTTLRTPTDFNI